MRNVCLIRLFFVAFVLKFYGFLVHDMRPKVGYGV